MKIDRSKVVHAAQMGIPLVIKTHILAPETEVELEEILTVFLDEMGQLPLRDHLSYCLRELTGNAKKANTKRVYFQERGLDLENPRSYAEGMKSFKNETLGNIDHYLKRQEEADLWIKVTFLIRRSVFYLSVRNNVAATTAELTRAFDRIARSRAFQGMEEAFEEVLDDSEGAGLGLTILILMLRKMGLGEKSFDLAVSGGDTIATLSIPTETVQLEQVRALTSELLDAVDDLPPFPENLTRLLKLLENPQVKFETVAAELSRDPALTAGLIKYLNSAQLGNRRKIFSLRDAVQIVGLQGLRDLIYPYGAHQVLAGYLDRQKGLWENAARVSAYAVIVAKDGNLATAERNLAQIGGLLYNLGQILVSHLHPEQSRRILAYCQSKGFGTDVFDRLTLTINPGELGAKVAEKWKFPTELVEVIRHLSRPQGAPPAVQPTCCAVHLAASLRWMEEGLLTVDRIDQEVLRVLRLSSDRLTSWQQTLQKEGSP